MPGSQQVGETLEHKDLRPNRRRHSTNWFIFCNVEDFTECGTLLLQEREKTLTLNVDSESTLIHQVCLHRLYESGFTHIQYLSTHFYMLFFIIIIIDFSTH